ncbi:protein MAIN-LIKE 2-like [Vicia villosa]|uniref:protein MAIN-LIKE 2-like n=1 Tax=Vicia villosa TaxID=3911 RepID=UPI00273BE858|nr:protein MAIN-LIKE 2-like [Vicia villosa]
MSFLWFGDKHRGTPEHVALADPEHFRTRTHKKLDPPAVIVPYLERSGFATVARIPHIHTDTSFVMALLERWRPESHTFHFPTGECTITLEDVSMLLGLRVNGKAVTGPTEVDLDMWEEFLGVQPPRIALKGRMILISWLKSLLANNPINENSTLVHLTTYTRIFNLLLIGLSLMPDKSSKHVHIMWVPLLQDLEECNTYSWGSAVLCYLYSEMCKSVNVEVDGMGGCVELLQAWGYTRLPFLAPITPQLPSYPYAARWAAKKKKNEGYPSTLSPWIP